MTRDETTAGSTEPSAALAAATVGRTRAQEALEPDPRFIYGLWGPAWLVGFGTFWLATSGAGPVDVPLGLAAIVLVACVGGSVAVTIVHVLRRTAGVRGPSSRTGTMYGWSWPLGFGCLTVIMAGAARAGVSVEAGSLLWSVLSALVVGLLYLGAGAMWQDGVQYGLGAWILVTAAVGALAGYPAVHLVMALVGGGGFVVAAVVQTLLAGRRRPTPRLA